MVAPACASTVVASVRALVRTVTRPPDAAAISSATLVSAMTWPRPTTTRWSALSCSSLIRWLDTSTARPWAASDRRIPRIHTMPSGSMPLNGSSIINTGGSPRSAAAIPSRCRMPRENPPALRRIAEPSPACSTTSSTRLASRPWEWASHSRWLPADRRGPLIGGIEAEDHPHRGGFPGAVRADEAGYLARRDRERHPVQGQHGPEPLAQTADFDGCFHAQQSGERRWSWSSRRGAVFASLAGGTAGSPAGVTLLPAGEATMIYMGAAGDRSGGWPRW